MIIRPYGLFFILYVFIHAGRTSPGSAIAPALRAKPCKSLTRVFGTYFDESKSAFYDESALLFFDEEHSDYEERYILPGMSEKLRIIIVCHCTFEENNIS